MGRPKKPKGEHKEVFSARFTGNELEAYEAAAKKAGVGLREWVRDTLNKAAE